MERVDISVCLRKQENKFPQHRFYLPSIPQSRDSLRDFFVFYFFKHFYMTDIITPEILRGTRDFLPEDMAKRQYVMEIIKKIFIRFGYDTIETPAIEYLKTLTGSYGDEGNKLMYKFEDNGGRKIALRYDQTVPTARVVAKNYQELPMPFKRYQISRVWRADRPAKGRYREFYQCDADVIGTESLVADAEIAKLIWSVCEELGFDNFIIKVNSRRLINAILEKLEIPSKNQIPVIRVLDKLDKIPRETVAVELAKIVDSKRAEELLEIVLTKGSNAEKIKAAQKYKVDEVKEFFDLCNGLQIPEKNLQFNLGLARGLDYYTGIIYEIILPDVDIGSICGGGRYDDLCSRFAQKKISGVGIAFGFYRIVMALEEKGILQDIGLSTQVLVTYFDNSTLQSSLKVVEELREAQIPAEIYFDPVKLGKQMKYANKKGIPFVVFCGQEEITQNQVKVKMMKNGTEKQIPRNQLIPYFEGLYLGKS